MTKKLLTLYGSLLAAANLVADDEGNVSTSYNGEKKPFVVKGKRLVLPTPEQRKNPDWSNRIAFHPLNDTIMNEESEVLERYRAAINTRTNITVAALAYDLLTLATSTGDHAKLNPDQSAFLSFVPDADEKTLDAFKRLIGKMPTSTGQRQFVTIYLKRGGVLEGRKHSRVGVVTFPLYAELKKVHAKGEDEIYDVKLRKKDVKTLTRLLEYLFPNIDKADHYSRASDSQQAPALDALMKAVQAVGGAINDSVDLFRNQLDEPDKLEFNSEWVDAFQNIDSLMHEARMIPMLSSTAAAAPEPAEAAAAAAAQPKQVHYPWTAQQQPTPFAQFAQQPVQAPTVVKTARGVDFDSLLRANPALGGTYAPAGMHVPPGAAGRDARAPSWAPGAGFGGGWGGGQQGGWGNAPGFGGGGGFVAPPNNPRF